ncbi:MAG: 5-(carboxyamino)imidazole ribonucleotide mutase [Sumerlaeia bacterium]
MPSALVGVVIGSRSDFNVMRRGLETLRVMGVPYIFEFISPFRTPDRVSEFALSASEHGIEIIIAASGGSSNIATQIAAYTNLPVIGVPVDASPLRGQDALYSMIQTPPGVPIATVGINNSENAAVLAAQILALKHPQFRTVLNHRRIASVQRLEGIRSELGNEYPELCLPEKTISDTVLVDSENETESDITSESATPEPSSQAAPIRPGAVSPSPDVRPPERPPAGNGNGAPASHSPAKLPPFKREMVQTPVPQEPAFAHPPSHRGIDRVPEPDAVIDPTPRDMPRALITVESSESLEAQINRDVAKGSAAAAPPEANLSISPEPEEDEPEDRTETIQTKVFKVNCAEPNEDIVEHAMMVLLEGNIVGLPTDTVYGLAADATNRNAIEQLYRLKGKDYKKTLGVLIHSPEMLDSLVREVPPALEKVIEKFWPGALTVILPKAPGTLNGITSSDRIGIRIPNNRLCLDIIGRVGRPIAMRNASVQADDAPVTTAEPLIEHFKGSIHCVLDGGECTQFGSASTVLSALGERFELLREGAISRQELKVLLGDVLKD